MGLLTTVIKKQETPAHTNSNDTVGDEKKILLNMTYRIEELKSQNMENAKFLRGISRKIEAELNQMREIEENRSIELYDDSAIVDSINRIEMSLKEINNNDILNAIDRINSAISDIKSCELIESIDKINDTLSKVNSDVLLIEIDKINKVLKEINSDSVLKEIAQVNDKLNLIQIDDVITEIHRVESIVSEINEKAVLAEIDNLKELINEKNSMEVMYSLDSKIKSLNSNDYTEQLKELESKINNNYQKIEELSGKIDRVSTMPTMLKSIIEHNNEENISIIEDILTELNSSEHKKTSSIRMIVNVNLWVSLLTAAVLIANILGVI